MRLIDIEPFETEKDVTRCQITRWRNGDGYADMVVTNTKDIPTIETEPKRGRCDYCRGASYSEKPFKVITHRGLGKDVLFNYCPNCGADMRTKEDEDATN